jgi:hypothetical protein
MEEVGKGGLCSSGPSSGSRIPADTTCRVLEWILAEDGWAWLWSFFVWQGGGRCCRGLEEIRVFIDQGGRGKF